MTQLISIEDLKSSTRTPRKWALFDLGFRPFFLLGSVFALLAIIPWILPLRGIPFSPTGGGLWWHGHELIFGFALAIIFGFLLTAGQNWTGVSSASGSWLAMLVGLWLLPRMLLPFGWRPWWLAMVLDIGAGLGGTGVGHGFAKKFKALIKRAVKAQGGSQNTRKSRYSTDTKERTIEKLC